MIDYLKPEISWLFLLTLIPIVIHFFIRSKTKKIPFPSVFFLKQAIQKRSQEIRFSQFLLLLIRILIFFFLALLLLQPFLKGRFFFSGITEGGSHYGILVDTSFSMNNTLSGESIFEKSKSRLLEYLEYLNPEDRITLLSTALNGTLLSKPFEPYTPEVSEVLNRLEPGKGSAHLLESYKTLLSLMEKSGDSPECILILSDFQSSDSKPLQDYLTFNAPSCPVLFLFPEEDLKKSPPNIYIRNMDIPYDSLIQPENPHFEAVVASSGNKPVKANLNALIRSDNIFKTSFDLNNNCYSFSIAYPDHDEKEQPLELLLSGDSFILDNTCYGILKNTHPYHILCINPPDEDPAFYLKKALLPNENRHSASSLPFVIENTSGAEKLPPLTKYDLVIASGFPNLPLQSFRSLQNYVTEGGGLILHFDKAFTLNSYHKILATSGNSEYPLLPASLEPLPQKETPSRQKMELTEMGKKILPALSDPISWDKFFINSFFPYSLKKDLSFDVLIKTGHSEPLLLFKTLGKGKIACFLTPLSPEPSPYVGEKLFVPLVHQLFQALTRKKNTPLSYFIGDTLPLPPSATRYLPPSGEDVKIEADKEQSPVLIPDEPGFYRIYDHDQILSTYAVNVPPSESLLEYASPHDFKFKNSRALSLDKTDAIKKFFLNKNSKTPLWILLLWLIIGLFLVENFILYRLRP